nr:MAG TPA: hypothetical protein [Caudoviricetes sp.]
MSFGDTNTSFLFLLLSVTSFSAHLESVTKSSPELAPRKTTIRP